MDECVINYLDLKGEKQLAQKVRDKLGVIIYKILIL